MATRWRGSAQEPIPKISKFNGKNCVIFTHRPILVVKLKIEKKRHRHTAALSLPHALPVSFLPFPASSLLPAVLSLSSHFVHFPFLHLSLYSLSSFPSPPTFLSVPSFSFPALIPFSSHVFFHPSSISSTLRFQSPPFSFPAEGVKWTWHAARLAVANRRGLDVLVSS